MKVLSTKLEVEAMMKNIEIIVNALKYKEILKTK